MSYIAFSNTRKCYLSKTKTNQWVVTSDVNSAYVGTVEKLNNVIDNQMSKTLDYDWTIQKFDTISKETNDFKGPHNAINRVENKETVEEREIHGCWVASDRYASIVTDLKEIMSFSSPEHIQLLTEKISEYDKELVDLEHFIELNSMSAYEGWLNSKRMKEILQKRRIVKQEIALARSISESKNILEAFDKVNSFQDRNVSKTYTCRTEYGAKLPWKEV